MRLQPEWSSRDRSAPSPGPDDPFPDREGATGAGESPYPARGRRCRRIRARARGLSTGGGGQAQPRGRPVVHRQDAELGELGRLHRRGRQRRLPHAGGLHRGDRHRGQLRRRRRRQQHLLRQGEGPARARPGHRRRHGLPHRLDGRPLDPLRLHAGTRPRQHPEHLEPQRRRSRAPTSTPAASSRCRGRADSPASAGTRRRSPAAWPPWKTCGTPSSRAASACSPRCATRWASSCSRTASTSPATGATPSSTEAIEVLREQVESGQVRNIKGNSYLEDLKSEDTLAAICWSGDITVINAEAGDKWEFAIPTAGGTLWNDNFLVPIGSAAEGQRRGAHELLLRARGGRRGRRVGELHHPGRRRQGGRRRDRPRARREPAHLPQRGDALAGAHLPHAQRGRGAEVPGASSRASSWAPDHVGS